MDATYNNLSRAKRATNGALSDLAYMVDELTPEQRRAYLAKHGEDTLRTLHEAARLLQLVLEGGAE